MTPFLEPLPGLLDDPQFQIPDLPPLTDYHIAPLRDPVPSRSIYAPSPLEPTAGNSLQSPTSSAAKHDPEKRKTPKISPSQFSSTRTTKKPNLSISELVEEQTEREAVQFQLPSFISLAIVERSPVQNTKFIDGLRPNKRPRLDNDDVAANDEYRHLPLPSQKDNQHGGRTKPLLPAMVTGLHEPPPTAALLPSMATEKTPSRSPKKDSRAQVDDYALDVVRRRHGRPPERMLNSPELTTTPLPSKVDAVTAPTEQETKRAKPTEPKKKESNLRSRRTPKKWTEYETDQLMQGVRKHGIGKWKQILADPDLTFNSRNSVDLKDRFRVRMPEAYRDRDLSIEETCPVDTTIEPKPQAPDAESSVSNVEENSNQRDQANSRPVMSTPVVAPQAATASALPGSSPAGEATSGAAAVSKNQRRKRRPWTTAEDADLMRGVQRHGFQWTMIHDDETLNLSHRKATDLRDRIRNMFPDGYKNAGTRSSSRKEPAEGSRTLPPLMLDDDGDWDWSNNTLPPLLEWEDMGM